MTEAVEITARDGTTLRGEVHGRGVDAVVLSHDRVRDLDSWRGLVDALAQDGLSVLAYDLRGHGGSDGERDPAREEEDLEDAIEFVRRTGTERLFLGAEGYLARAALACAERVGAAALFALCPQGAPADLPPASSVPKLVLLPAGDPLEDAAPRIFAGRAFVVGLPAQAPLLESSWGANVRDYVIRFLRDVRLRAPVHAP